MNEPYLPIDVTFHANWWYRTYGLTFDWEFYYDVQRRISQERQMRQLLYDRFGDLGLGQKNAPKRPVIGPILLGGGYIIQEILGCEIEYRENAPAWVWPRNLSEAETWDLQVPDDIDTTPTMRNVMRVMDSLEKEFGYLQGDIPLHSVVNVAVDLRGQDYFTDLIENPELVEHLNSVIAKTIYKVAKRVKPRTGSIGTCITRVIASFKPDLFTIANCNMQMISPRMYEQFLLKHDSWLGECIKPFGFHHCGENTHLFAPFYAQARGEYLDIGWGSDIRSCRNAMPNSWLSLRVDPVRMQTASPQDAPEMVSKLLQAHGEPWDRVAIVCSGIDYGTSDETIRSMFNTVSKHRGNRDSGLQRAYQIA